MNEDRHGFSKGLLENPWIAKLGALFLLFATIFIAAKAVNAVINFDTIAEAPANVITVAGEGKVSAVPNLATVSFTISENATTASAAQDSAAKKVNISLAVLDELGIDEKDIKTSSYNIYPRYNNPAPCYAYPCPDYEQRIVGYTASQTVDVKVRDTEKVGDVLARLGDSGISNLYGPNFTIEDQDALVSEARKEAIKKAREEAQKLAAALGVRIVRIVSFNEGGYGYPMPYYGRDMAMGGVAESKVTAPSIPTGENEITVNVSITYEIR